jgi:hypothetical protein
MRKSGMMANHAVYRYGAALAPPQIIQRSCDSVFLITQCNACRLNNVFSSTKFTYTYDKVHNFLFIPLVLEIFFDLLSWEICEPLSRL